MTSQISTDRPAPFTRGDVVETIKGAEFWGVLISIEHDDPENPGGTVKATAPGFRGTKHVYPLKQLRLRAVSAPSQPVQELHELPRHAGEDDLVERLRARGSDPVLGHDYLWHAAADELSMQAAARISSDSALLATVMRERDAARRTNSAMVLSTGDHITKRSEYLARAEAAESALAAARQQAIEECAKVVEGFEFPAYPRTDIAPAIRALSETKAS